MSEDKKFKISKWLVAELENPDVNLTRWPAFTLAVGIVIVSADWKSACNGILDSVRALLVFFATAGLYYVASYAKQERKRIFWIFLSFRWRILFWFLLF